MNAEVSALVLAWIAILILSLAVAGLYRQLQMLAGSGPRIRSMGPARGAPAPGLQDDLARHPGTKLLLFVNSTCPPCRMVLDEADQLAGMGTDPVFIAVFEGSSDGFRSDDVRVLSEAAGAFAEFNVQVRPFAVVVDPSGKVVRTKPIGSREALHLIVEEARSGAAAVGGEHEPVA